MLRENATIIVARNERWQGNIATEPVECGWASEAIFFVRMLGGTATDAEPAEVAVEISPDGMHWTAAGVTGRLPTIIDDVTALRVNHFGNWLRLVTRLADNSDFTALVSLHLK